MKSHKGAILEGRTSQDAGTPTIPETRVFDARGKKQKRLQKELIDGGGKVVSRKGAHISPAHGGQVAEESYYLESTSRGTVSHAPSNAIGIEA